MNALVTSALDKLCGPDGVISDVYSGVVTLDTIENVSKSDIIGFLRVSTCVILL